MRTHSPRTALAFSLLVAAAALARASMPAADAGPGANERPPLPIIETEGNAALLLDVADHLGPDERQRLIREIGGLARLNSDWSDGEGLYRILLPVDRARAVLGRYADDPRVEFIEPEGEVSLLGTPNDPLYLFQWNFDQVNAEAAWQRATGEGVTVAVIDTGVARQYGNDARFPTPRDLLGTTFTDGWDFVADHDRPFDDHGHGTHVAGTIAQTTNNGFGVAGLAPRARIMPIRVLDSQGRGSTGDIAEAIRWAADNGAHIINMSLGGPLPSRIMDDAVRHARKRGVVVIAAAGNSGHAMPAFPAAYDGVIAVAATQFDKTTTFYSNFGNYIDIAAPGGNTRVDQNGDGRPDGIMQETIARGDPRQHEFALYMGTSMASPHVAAIAALIRSAGVTRPERIEAVLLETASRDVPAWSQQRYGAGIADAGAAVARARSANAWPAMLAALGVLGLAFGSPSNRRDGLRAPIAGAVAIAAIALPAFAWPLAAPLVPAFPTATGLAGALAESIRALGGLAVASAGVLIALHAGSRTTRSAAWVSASIGAMVALTAWLVVSAVAPWADVPIVPGSGALDRLWLAANGAIGIAITWAAARRAP